MIKIIDNINIYKNRQEDKACRKNLRGAHPCLILGSKIFNKVICVVNYKW
jgi:hypothetical protein